MTGEGQWSIVSHPLADTEEAYVPPAWWDHPHVIVRMVMAMDVLARIRTTVGPQAYTSAWPAYMHDWEDLLAQEEGETGHLRRTEETRIVIPPRTLEVSLMEEALAWTGRYLRGERVIALPKWAWCRVIGRESRFRRWARRKRIGNPGHRVMEEAMIVAAGLRKDRIPVR
jgi:hypothetical protein